MAKAKNTIERIKFIPERNPGDPAGELIEGEVIHTSKSGNQKIVKTDDQSVHVISNLDGPGKADGDWESISTLFDFNKIVERIETSDEMFRMITSFFGE